jgi:MFS family permease
MKRLFRPLLDAPIAFQRLALVQALHGVGDAMVAVALANTLFFAVPLGEARDKVGLYLLLTMTPFAVLSPLVGPWLDRRRGAYRLGLILSGAARGVLAIALSSRTDGLALFPLAFGLLVMSRVHGISRSAIVPHAIGDEKPLIWANAWLSVISVAGAALGAALAGGLQKVLSTDVSLWVASLVFFAMTVPAVALPRPGRETRAKQKAEDFRGLLTSRLIAAGVTMGASRASVGFVTFLLAFLLRAHGEGTSGMAVAVGAAGAGGLLGSTLAPVLRRILHEPVMLVSCLVVMGSAALWAAANYSLSTAALAAGAVGFGASAGRLAFDSLVQREAPEHVRGRTFARYETIFQLCWVAGAGIATLIPFHSRGGMRALAAICFGGIALSVYGLARRASATTTTEAVEATS